MEKTFVGGCKITKFIKVFSLESFPLYDNVVLYIYTCMWDGKYELYTRATLAMNMNGCCVWKA